MSSQISLDDPTSLVNLHVYSTVGGGPSLAAQAEERVQLVRAWSIKPAERVLELGCGQGDTTIALAVAVGDQGKVVAIDPAPLDYGSPKTLGEAQAFLKAGPLGERIEFHRHDATSYLSSKPDNTLFDAAILAQCLWYFKSPSQIRDTLELVGRSAKRVCVAEYSLSSTKVGPNAHVHVLAALTQASLECRKPESDSNIRTVVSPTAIKDLATQAGLKLVKEEVVVPPKGMYDGSWEVGAVRSESFLEEVETYVKDEREKAVILAMRDGVIQAREALVQQGEKVRTMDVWVAVFEKA